MYNGCIRSASKLLFLPSGQVEIDKLATPTLYPAPETDYPAATQDKLFVMKIDFIILVYSDKGAIGATVLKDEIGLMETKVCVVARSQVGVYPDIRIITAPYG